MHRTKDMTNYRFTKYYLQTWKKVQDLYVTGIVDRNDHIFLAILNKQIFLVGILC